MLEIPRMRYLHPFVAFVAIGMIHCVPPAASGVARSRAAGDIPCPQDQVVAYEAAGGRYVARGCHKWVEYDCVSTGRGTVYAETVCAARGQPVLHEESAER